MSFGLDSLDLVSSYEEYYNKLNDINIKFFDINNIDINDLLISTSPKILFIHNLLFLYNNRKEKESTELIDYKKLIIEKNMYDMFDDNNSIIDYKREIIILNYLNNDIFDNGMINYDNFYDYKNMNISKNILKEMIIKFIQSSSSSSQLNNNIFVSPFKESNNLIYNKSLSRLLKELMVFMPSSIFYIFPIDFWYILTYSFMIRSIIMNNKDYCPFSIQNKDIKIYKILPDIFNPFKYIKKNQIQKRIDDIDYKIFGINHIDNDIYIFKKQIFQLRNMILSKYTDPYIIDSYYNKIINDYNYKIIKKKLNDINIYDYNKIQYISNIFILPHLKGYFKSKVLASYIIGFNNILLNQITKPGNQSNNNQLEEEEEGEKIIIELSNINKLISTQLNDEFIPKFDIITYYNEYDYTYPEFKKLLLFSNNTSDLLEDFILSNNIYLLDIEKNENIYILKKDKFNWNLPINFKYIPFSTDLLQLNIPNSNIDSIVTNHGIYYESFLDLLNLICNDIKINIKINSFNEEKEEVINNNIDLDLNEYMNTKINVFSRLDNNDDRIYLFNQYYFHFINKYINTNINNKILNYLPLESLENKKIINYINKIEENDIDIETDSNNYNHTSLFDLQSHLIGHIKSIVFNIILKFNNFTITINNNYIQTNDILKSLKLDLDEDLYNNTRNYRLITLDQDDNKSLNLIDMINNPDLSDVIINDNESYDTYNNNENTDFVLTIGKDKSGLFKFNIIDNNTIVINPK